MTLICGVDVSGQWLDAKIGLDGVHARFSCTCEGIASLAGFCRQHGAGLVVFEATGGYEKLPFALLWAEGIACAIVNPRAVRHLAEALGYLEKTDRIDAGVIAKFAEVRQVKPTALPSSRQDRLRALVDRLRQLTILRIAQSNQARLVSEPLVAQSIQSVLEVLETQSKTFEGEIASLIDDDPLWSRLDKTFRTIKGVSDRTVATLMALMPEIGTLNNKAIAKLAGLAPLAKDSGKRSGRRPIRGGRQEVRDILFLITQTVRLYNKHFQDFNERLLKAGKPKRVVRVALARKLIVQLNAKARDARRELEITT